MQCRISASVAATASYGGTWGGGCAYKLSPAGKLTVLHAFGESGDGIAPGGNIVFYHGDVFGTTGEHYSGESFSGAQPIIADAILSYAASNGIGPSERFFKPAMPIYVSLRLDDTPSKRHRYELASRPRKERCV